MKKILNIFLILSVLASTSCEDLIDDDFNDNPNRVGLENLSAEDFLRGAQLANTLVQAGHLNRIAGLWSGQLEGFASVYGNVYDYNISTAETEVTWGIAYTGVLTNTRYMLETSEDDDLALKGIAKVLEAHAIGTIASLHGDIPYSEINGPLEEAIEKPVFDSQSDVFTALIALLNDAIDNFDNGVTRTGIANNDIYYGGDIAKWRMAANTLKARYYLQMKDYANALTAAQSGISLSSESMIFTPIASAPDDSNLFWQLIGGGAREGDIGTGSSYLMQMLDPSVATSRNNAKTNEDARFQYYTIPEEDNSNGVAAQDEPHQLITYEENQLILAECEARINGLAAGLTELNVLRAWLNGGGRLNDAFSGQPYQYDPYVAVDFAAGGIENADNIGDTRALLREIIEERFVSGFGMYTAFNDARRLRKADSDIAVSIPLNSGTATAYPERFPYADDELNSNPNAPTEDPGIYQVTEVNQ